LARHEDASGISDGAMDADVAVVEEEGAVTQDEGKERDGGGNEKQHAQEAVPVGVSPERQDLPVQAVDQESGEDDLYPLRPQRGLSCICACVCAHCIVCFEIIRL
jgi:hypothetical protein